MSLSPRTLALVTNVFLMWWNDQLGVPDPTLQIQFFLINQPKLKGFIVRVLICSVAGSLGPNLEIETCIYFSTQEGEAASLGSHQISISI